MKFPILLALALFSCASAPREVGTRILMTDQEIRFVMPEERKADVVSVLRDPKTSYWQERTCWNEDCGTYRCTLGKQLLCHWTEEAVALRKFISETGLSAQNDKAPAPAFAADSQMNVSAQALANCEAMGEPTSDEARRECIRVFWSKYANRDERELRRHLLPLCADGRIYCKLGEESIGGSKVRPRYPAVQGSLSASQGEGLEYFEKE